MVNKTPINRPPDEAGCVWIRQNDKKQEYLSIKIEIDGQEYFFKGFLNSKKTKNHEDEKKPTYILYKSKDNSNKKEDNTKEIQDREYKKLLERDRAKRLD